MDYPTQPEVGADSARKGLRAVAMVAVLVGAMVALAIGGSALWRPTPLPDTTLELGRTELVSFADAGPNETIPRVLDIVSPTVGSLIIEETQRSGSGVVVHEAGFMITNAHVVEDATRLVVIFPGDLRYDAEVWGVHPQTDIAVVKIDSEESLPVAPLGDSDALRVGEFVLALGAPFRFAETVTAGIVSGLHRRGLGIARYEDFIVTDAPINPGNSGGPLVNLRGEVVGINTAIVADPDSHPGRGTFAGVGFAVPINVARAVAENLIGDGGLAAESLRVLAAAGREREDTESATVSGAPNSGSAANTSLVVSPQRRSAVARVRGFDEAGDVLDLGSGFVIGAGDGQVVITNAHVVRGAYRVEVSLYGRTTLRGEVIHSDAGVDLAVVRLRTEETLPQLELGSASSLAPGDSVFALGARDSEETTVSQGRVTSLSVRVSAAMATELIQTSAAIVPGDSGGPLLDAAGEVVGVVVARDDQPASEGGEPRSYAIPVTEVERVIDSAEATSDADGYRRGFRGLLEAEGGGDRGIGVVLIEPDGPAERAGLQHLDLIIAADAQSLADPEVAKAWLDSLEQLEFGASVEIEVRRRAGEMSLNWLTLTLTYTMTRRGP